MKNKISWIFRKTELSLMLILFFAVFSPVSAEKNQESRYLEDLKMARQELTEAKGALVNLKLLYAEKEIQSRDLKSKLNKISEDLRRYQDSATKLNKEKEILSGQQAKVILQLKQSETEKFVLAQQNQILTNCSKENEAKNKELIALRNSFAQDKKDLLNKIQNSEIKLSEVTLQRDALSQKKSDLEVRYSVLSAQVLDIQNQQISCFEQKEALAIQVQNLEREVDTLRKNLASAGSNSQELEDSLRRIKKLEGFELELIQMRRNYAQLENKLKMSGDENQKLAEIASKYDKQANLQQDLALVRRKLLAAENENQSLKDISAKYEEQKELEQELQNLRKALLKSEEQKLRVQEICAKFKKQEEDLEARLMDLTKKLTVLQEENKKLESASLKMPNEKIIMGELSGLREELSKCKEEKKQLEKDSLRDKKDKEISNSELVKLRKRVSLLESENKKFQELVSKSRANKSALQEAAILKEELRQLKSENKALKVRAEKDIKLSQATPPEVIKLRSSLACLETERDRLKSEIERFKKQQEALMAQLNKMPVAAKPASALKAGSENNVVRSKEDLQVTKELSYRLVQEKSGYQKRERELSQTLLNTQNQKTALEQDKVELLKKNKELEGVYAKLTEQIAKVMVRYSELEKQKQTTAVKSEGCQQEIKFMQDKLKSSELLTASLQIEVENLKKANKDLEVKVFNAKEQKEQEVDLIRARLEQQNVLKEGEYVQLNNKFQEYQVQKEMELKRFSDNVDKLKIELQNSQELSFRLVQEKSSFQSQQKQVTGQLKQLQSQNALIESVKQELEKQNVFLKNQYVASSQELDTVKKENSKLAKEKAPVKAEGCQEELESLKSRLAEKDQDYLKNIKEYEAKYKDLGATDKNKDILINDLARLKNNYEALQKKYELSEKSRKGLEAMKNRYGKLPEENAKLHYNLGVVYAQLQEYQKAVGELEKVIQLNPDDPEALYNLGVINGEYLGDRKKSVEYFEKYLVLAPNDSEADRIRKYIVTWKAFGQELND